MPSRFSLLLFFFFSITALNAQTKLTGNVKDAKGTAMPGVNVFIKGSYDGISTDASGNYSFTTTENGEQILSATFIGFEPQDKKVILVGQDQTINFTLVEKSNELNTVTITAGSFEASDEKKMVMLRPLDIVTTAGAAGDIYGAIQTLPGAQPQFEQEGLFVRGGDASEAKTFIDGLAVANPYFNSVPDVPQRGRFSPFLFKGTNFSTGGYSAQYGGAMSSALILESEGVSKRSITNISLMSVGAGIGHIKKFKSETSLGGFVSYFNLKPYMTLAKQDRDWEREPSSFNSSLIFRHKPNKTGILKAFANFDYGDLSLNYPDIEDPEGKDITHFGMNSYNFFGNASYKDFFSDTWTLYAAVSYSKNNKRIHPADERLVFVNNNMNGRLTLTKQLGALSSIKAGAESEIGVYNNLYNNFRIDTNEIYNAGYIEGDFYLTKKFVARAGARAEQSYILRDHNIAPRVSLAYKTGKYSQFSFAYGDFYQKPNDEYILQQYNITFSKATHYMLNFQKVDDKRTFRIEGYFKQYNKLIKTEPSINNNGKGFAQGFDIFWRDKKTFKYTDYWISYSYLDTKREYLDYPISTQPTYAAKHVVSVVYKRWIPKINTSMGFTYSYASGRPYFNPNKTTEENFLTDRTKDYHNLSFTGSWLTSIGKNFTVVVLSVGNVPGVKNVFSYHYSSDGLRREEVGPTSLRMFFVGMFITIGEDRAEEI